MLALLGRHLDLDREQGMADEVGTDQLAVPGPQVLGVGRRVDADSPSPSRTSPVVFTNATTSNCSSVSSRNEAGSSVRVAAIPAVTGKLEKNAQASAIDG
jgi:hypothetical protein